MWTQKEFMLGFVGAAGDLAKLGPFRTTSRAKPPTATASPASRVPSPGTSKASSPTSPKAPRPPSLCHPGVAARHSGLNQRRVACGLPLRDRRPCRLVHPGPGGAGRGRGGVQDAAVGDGGGAPRAHLRDPPEPSGPVRVHGQDHRTALSPPPVACRRAVRRWGRGCAMRSRRRGRRTTPRRVARHPRGCGPGAG